MFIFLESISNYVLSLLYFLFDTVFMIHFGKLYRPSII
jgi:hypothetical protein